MSLKEKFDKATRVPEHSSKTVVEFLSGPLKTPYQRIAAIFFFASLPFWIYLFSKLHNDFGFLWDVIFLSNSEYLFRHVYDLPALMCRLGLIGFFCSYLAKFWLFPIINWVQSAKK